MSASLCVCVVGVCGGLCRFYVASFSKAAGLPSSVSPCVIFLAAFRRSWKCSELSLCFVPAARSHAQRPCVPQSRPQGCGSYFLRLRGRQAAQTRAESTAIIFVPHLPVRPSWPCRRSCCCLFTYSTSCRRLRHPSTQSCDFSALLKAHAPLPATTAMAAAARAPIDAATSHNGVFAFVRGALLAIVPPQLWGTNASKRCVCG